VTKPSCSLVIPCHRTKLSPGLPWFILVHSAAH
jgi:hypothetical protein